MCPAFHCEMSLLTGQNTGTGHTRAHGERDIVPVPFPRPDCPADVPVGVTAVSFLRRAEALLQTGVLTPWQRAFVAGCRRHVDAGRSLSEKQVDVLRTLINIASDAPTALEP